MDALTADVVTEKFAELAPAFTVTFAGTVTAALPVERSTTTPPAGATEVNVTVPVADCPPVTLDGLTPTELSAARGCDAGL